MANRPRPKSIGMRITPAVPAGLTYTTSDIADLQKIANCGLLYAYIATKWPARVGVPQKMEVILTLSNRIPLAGALPILVAFALAVLIAAIALAPLRPASATPNSDLCGLSPVILDMLLDRQGANAQQCDTIEPATGTQLTASESDPLVWDLSGNDDRSLTEFAISDDDAKLLRIFNSEGPDTADPLADDGPVIAEAVRYIDLTGNPLTIDDVNFKHIPSTVAIILSADSNTNGFQDTEYTVTEDAASYVAVAFPDLELTAATAPLAPSFTISGRDALDDFETNEQPFQENDHRQLIIFGSGTGEAARTSVINSVSDNRIFYLPLKVNKDNDNGDEWDFTINISDEIGNAVDDYELANDYTDITVIDVDAPATLVCDRSEDVETTILDLVSADGVVATYGDHTKCDDITLRDLGAIGDLTVDDGDNEGEPIANLVAGDFEGLTKLTRLHIIGAGSLPSGIFAEVGKDTEVEIDGVTVETVQITFAKNNNGGDEDIAEVGKYTPSTIPQHIFADQEAGQVIVLDDDLDDDDKGVTKGLDATGYSVTEGSQFFIMTPAMHTYYVLGKSAVLAAGTAVSTPVLLETDPVGTPPVRGNADSPKVVRYALSPADDDNSDDESVWLFLFNAAAPENADNLVDLATVAVADDD